MTRGIVVLRPEPGNGATASALRERGQTVTQLPLFEVRPIIWTPPDPADHDALMLSSANTLRHAGAGLAALGTLPVLAVGKATATAAHAAGLDVVLTGAGHAADLVQAAQEAGYSRILHLGGRDAMTAAGGIIAQSLVVYASDSLAIDAAAAARLEGQVAMIHSARAGTALADIADTYRIDRATIRIAAISPAVAHACGEGWGQIAIAGTPTDAALADEAVRLTD